MLTFPELTIYISHTCDLACDKCFTFNNLNWSGNFQIDKSVESLKGIVEFKEIFILGGEPLLHPYLAQWMQWSEYMWPSSKKWLVTNGRHLDKLPKDWTNAWHLEISAHSISDLTKIFEWVDYHNITYTKFYNDKHTDARWHYKLILNDQIVGELSESWHFIDMPVILSDNKPIYWNALNDKIEQHSLCPTKECMHLLNGRFYRCPQQAILPQLSKKFQIADPFKTIATMDVGCPPEEFIKWIKTKDVPQDQCQLCNWSHRIELPANSKIKKIKVLQI